MLHEILMIAGFYVITAFVVVALFPAIWQYAATYGMSGEEIYQRLKAGKMQNISLFNFTKLRDYLFSEEMRVSGEDIPTHIRRMFPGQRIITTAHIKREPHLLQQKMRGETQ